MIFPEKDSPLQILDGAPLDNYNSRCKCLKKRLFSVFIPSGDSTVRLQQSFFIRPVGAEHFMVERNELIQFIFLHSLLKVF